MSGSVSASGGLWRCQQNPPKAESGQECPPEADCGAPETPSAAGGCVFCGDSEGVRMIPMDHPTNYQPVCEGCLENFQKNCEPGE